MVVLHPAAPLSSSFTKLTVISASAEQASLIEAPKASNSARDVAAAGNASVQINVLSLGGQVTTGGVVSSIIICAEQLTLLLQSSVTVKLTVKPFSPAQS